MVARRGRTGGFEAGNAIFQVQHSEFKRDVRGPGRRRHHACQTKPICCVFGPETHVGGKTKPIWPGGRREGIGENAIRRTRHERPVTGHGWRQTKPISLVLGEKWG